MSIWEWSQLGTLLRFLTGLMEVFFHEAHFVKSKETRQREVLQSFDGAGSVGNHVGVHALDLDKLARESESDYFALTTNLIHARTRSAP